ncbi:unnamed protein product [Caretta caretta]
MAAQVWSLPFLLHWAVLSGTLTLGWAEGPCEKQFRIRQEGPGAEGRAGSPVQVVMVCGVAVAVLYSLIKAVASDPECEEEEEAEEAQSEASEGCSTVDSEVGSKAVAVPSRPACTPRKAKERHLRRLSQMERELQGFLNELRRRREALETQGLQGSWGVQGEEICPPEWDLDKLRVTVYEISEDSD